MSTRNVRKLFGTTTLPPLEGNSDEEFEPLYAKKKGQSSTFTYDGLKLSSNSESDDNGIPNIIEAEDEVIDKKKKKKKKKQRKPKPDPIIPEGVELDEIDRSVLEVNAILGGPPSPCTSAPVEKKSDPVKQLLSVQSKYLNYHNEIKKMFGSETPDDEGRPKKCRPHNVVKYRRALIIPTPENYHFQKIGLSMSLLRKENGCSYFAFNHSREYQKMHQNFLDILNPEDVMPIDESRVNIHIEALLETADYMFRTEEFTAANSILEQIITYFQYAAHPYFNLTDQSIRLEYKYMENRPFFVAVLKYLHMLTNKACHRTALELAKLLLNLDPSDPLAIIYIIDVLALRAREHQWLVNIIEYWSKERDANYLFNIKYSYALANYHVIKKSKTGDFSRADELLKEAMLAFPTVTAQILEASKHEASAHIQKHPVFSNLFEEKYKTPDKLKTAITLYSKLVCWKWREPAVMEWFLRNANELLHQYETDPSIKKKLEDCVITRQNLFAVCPTELHRHLIIVRPMANLLVEWEMPRLVRTRAWDPLPPGDSVNRYGYGLSEVAPNFYSALINLFSSLRPNFFLQEHRERRENNGLQAAPERPIAERPPVENPPAERVPAERPLAERPPAERPLAERPLAERPLAQRPPAERPPAERPPAEQPTDVPASEEDTTDDEIDEETAAELASMRMTFVQTLIQAASVQYDEDFDRDWDINFEDI